MFTLDLMWSLSPDIGLADDGFAVSSAGDVNGDGFDDVIVSAPNASDGESLEGQVYVYYGSPTGPVLLPSWTADVDQAEAAFGSAVAAAGDVNGDGFDDVIIGAPLQGDGVVNGGLAHVFLGSASGLATEPVWSVGIVQDGAAFGASVASAGDVDSDGYDDVIVGADRFHDGADSEGAATVFRGGPTGIALVADWIEQGNQTMAFYGASVAAVDVTADTYADVIIGAPGHSAGQPGEGNASLWIGGPNGVDYELWNQESNQAGAAYGGTVASAGDVDGDGLGDVLVGAAGYDDPEIDEGRVFAYHGSQWGLSGEPSWSAEGNQAGAGFGVSTASAGDVNNDGYGDVVVGAAGYDGTLGEDEGRVYIYLGGADGLGDTPIEIASDEVGSRFGDVVASAGDVDGDGYDDVIVAAPQHDGGAGKTFVFAGTSPEDDLDGDGSPRPFDCDDRDETVYPGAPELCDGKDNACGGGVPDEDADLDGDGTATCDGDCDDANPAVHPRADEVCDGADNNCDGALDPETCDDAADDHCDGTVDEDCGTTGCGCNAAAMPAGIGATLLTFLLAVLRRKAPRG